MRLGFALMSLALGACNVYDEGLVRDAGVDAPSDASSDGAVDSGQRDAAVDAGPPRCPLGFHICEGACIRDLANMPENGCALGCGDPCVPPVAATASCSGEGACDFECDSGYDRVGLECVCAPLSCEDLGVECGSTWDGCNDTITCGSCPGAERCMSGTCDCPRDSSEANDTTLTARLLGTFNDYDDRDESWTRSWHSASDDDWYVIDIEDGYDFNNPSIQVLVSGPRPSDGYAWDIAAAFACSNLMNESVCTTGTNGSELGYATCGRTPDSSGRAEIVIDTECGDTNDEAGRLVIRVRPRTVVPNMCPSYVLKITVT